MATTKPNMEEKVWGAVSYVWVLSLVALAARKNNDYVRFHASQGTLLFILSLIFMIIPVIGWIINIFLVIAMVIGIVKSLQGKKWELPLVAGVSKSLADWIVKKAKL